MNDNQPSSVSDILGTAAAWIETDGSVAIATVIETWGSAPVRAGGQMIVSSNGQFAGSVSGGCVEGDVIAAGDGVLATGKPELLSFGVDDETAWRSGLPCGGTIKVLIARATGREGVEVFRRLDGYRQRREAAVTATDLATGELAVYGHDTLNVENPIRDALENGVSRTVDLATGTVYLRVYPARPRVLVIGATHAAQHLARFLEQLDFELHVIDPRSAFASGDRFAGVALVNEWPKAALATLVPDAATAFVLLSHVAAIDDEALHEALHSPARYIGALGSKRTHARRVERLTAAGFDVAAISRIRAPVGLDIGAQTPAEIALSIAAEVVAAFRGKAARA